MPHYCKREVWTLASRVKGAAQVLFFFYIYCVFLIFGPASISGPLFTSFQEEPTFHSITALSYLFKHQSCPKYCQTRQVTRIDLHISRLNTSLKRRKICRSSEREKYVQIVFIILFVEIFTCKEYWIYVLNIVRLSSWSSSLQIVCKALFVSVDPITRWAESQQNKHKCNNSNSEDQRLAQTKFQFIFISKDVQRTLAFLWA